MNAVKRHQNEKEFENWENTVEGGRKYWFDVKGKSGGSARYVKVTNENEKTISFTQEIYDAHGTLIETHEKYPIDKGHRKVIK